MNEKSEAFHYFKVFEAMAVAHFNLPLSRFRCDSGGEYLSNEMKAYFETKGIQYECAIRDTPEQVGVAERMIRSVAEKARCMLIESKLNKNLWNEAVLAAVYVINRSPTSALKDKTPAETWYGYRPNLRKIKNFGCRAYLRPPKRLLDGKFSSRTLKCYMVGYCHNGYRLCCPAQNQVLEGRDVTFDESKFINATSEYKPDEFVVPRMESKIPETNRKRNIPEEINTSETEVVSVAKGPEQEICKDFTFGDKIDEIEDFVLFALSATSFVENVPQTYCDIGERNDKEK